MKATRLQQLCQTSTWNLRVGMYACEINCPLQVFCSVYFGCWSGAPEFRSIWKIILKTPYALFHFKLWKVMFRLLYVSIVKCHNLYRSSDDRQLPFKELVLAVILDLLGEKITLAIRTVSTQVWRAATNFKRRDRTVTSSGSWTRQKKKRLFGFTTLYHPRSWVFS